MTQEDINEVVTKSMPQWKKDQFDAIYANADYIEGLRRRIERLEEKLKSHNKDYAELEKLYYQQLRRTDKLEADYEELENQRDELRNALNETMLGYDMWLETNGYSYENYDKYKQLLARIKEGEK